MTHEVPQPGGPFGFTNTERLDERISHDRFAAILTDERAAVHHMEVASNDHGEFLFVTMSQQVGEERKFLTFWGLGFHEPQERWLTDEWHFDDTQQLLHQMPQQIAPVDAQTWIQERRDQIDLSINPPLKK